MFVEVPVDRLSILSLEVSMEVPEEEPLSVEVSVEVSGGVPVEEPLSVEVSVEVSREVPVEEQLMVGVLEGVPIVLVNRLIKGVDCRSENV